MNTEITHDGITCSAAAGIYCPVADCPSRTREETFWAAREKVRLLGPPYVTSPTELKPWRHWRSEVLNTLERAAREAG